MITCVAVWINDMHFVQQSHTSDCVCLTTTGQIMSSDCLCLFVANFLPSVCANNAIVVVVAVFQCPLVGQPP